MEVKSIIVPPDRHRVRRDQISSAALEILSCLRQAGYLGYVVGGAIRDLQLGREPRDFDVVTDAKPAELTVLFPRARVQGATFQVTVVRQDGEEIEVATLRDYDMSMNGTVESDIYRRDFTINTMYFDPRNQTIIAHPRAFQDLQARKLRLVQTAAQGYGQHPIRMLRAVRLASQLGFQLAPDALEGIRVHKARVKELEGEQIFDEMFQMALTGDPTRILKLLRESGLSAFLFPALAPTPLNYEAWFATVLQTLERYFCATTELEKAVFCVGALLWPFLGTKLKGADTTKVKETIIEAIGALQLPHAYIDGLVTLFLSQHSASAAMDTDRFREGLALAKLRLYREESGINLQAVDVLRSRP